MFNSEKLFCKYSNQLAVKWQSSTNHFTLNYDEIIQGSKLVADALLGVSQEFMKNEGNIGVLLHHSAEIVPVILGILDLQASFCCLNPNQSSVELQETISLLQCNIGIADQSFAQKYSKEFTVLKELHLFNKRMVVLRLTDDNSDSGTKSSRNDIDDKDVFQSSKIMFCCSTSGTTGKPKMVQVPFKCLMPNVFSLSKHYQITQSDVIYISSPPTFDPFVLDLFLALFNGATILMVSNNVRLSTTLLATTIQTNSVTIMQITPSLFRRFSKEQIQNRLLSSLSSLRCLILGGEPFPAIDEVASWFDENGEIKMHKRLFNIYGITEVSCWATMYEVSLMDIVHKNLIPIGLPLDRYTALRVQDPVTKEFIQSGIGELFIESKVRKCILRDNNSQTVEVLVSVPTGDLVEVKSETIFYKTRLNNMVKVFGRKVNLTKIENTAKSNWSIRNACCVHDDETNAINLFVQVENGRKYTTKEILQGLRQKLMEQEVPNEIYFVDEFPLSCHGKVSKSKLLESIKKSVSCLYREYFLKKLEENLPSFNETTLNLSFLAAGGTSVLALQLVNELENKFSLSDTELIAMILSSDISIEQILSRLQEYTPNIVTTNLSETVPLMPSTWSHDMEKCIDASPTICTIDNRTIVSVGSHSHVLINVDLESGQLLSKLNLPDRIECQVVQYKNYGIVGCYDGFVYCFDICNGTEKWKFNSGGVVKSRMCIVENVLVFGNYNAESNLWCLQVDDGKLVWNTKIGDKSIYAGITTAPNNKLFVATLDGVCALVEPLTGKSLWETKLQSPVFSTPKIFGNKLIVAEVLGIVHCIDYCNGDIQCSYKANGNIYSSIESIGENLICFGCYDKSVYCLSVDIVASLFKLLWKVAAPAQIFSAPRSFMFDSRNLVLVCTTNGFVCVLNANGTFVKQFRINGEIFSTPSVIDSKVIVGSRNNLLYCFEIDKILSRLENKAFRFD